MRWISYSLILIISILSCIDKKENKPVRFWSKDKKLNILNIQPTNFQYNGQNILKLDVPSEVLYTNFVTSQYIIVNGLQVNTLYINPSCIKSYTYGNYKILEGFKEIKTADFNRCNIIILPFLDFSINQGVTKKYYDKRTLRLDKVFYDPLVKDSLYQFTRNWGDDFRNTVIFASKKHGIVGLYDVNKVIDHKVNYFNSYGRTNLKDAAHTEIIFYSSFSFDLGKIKYFNKE